MSADLKQMISEYISNSERVIADLQKEAEDQRQRIQVLSVPASPSISKEAAASCAAALVGKGWMTSEDLNYKIDRLRADPLGVITQLVKTAAAATPLEMGEPADIGTARLSSKKRSAADVALLSRLGLL